MVDSPRIGFVGMTHLGINSMVAAAQKGFQVTGFDQDVVVINEITAGILPIIEPDLDQLFESNRDRILMTNDPNDISMCDLVYIAPDVATNDTGESDLGTINALLDVTLSTLGEGAIAVILSQVPPGFTRARVEGRDDLFYQVETLVFGRAMERALYPERFIVGCAEPEVPLPDALKTFLSSFDCPILPMRFESAELAKISINCCLVASITVANTLGELCESIGADWSEIAPALKLDKRIGLSAYLSPGLGIAGGNLERDLATVIRMSNDNNTDAGVVEAWVANSKRRKIAAADMVRQRILPSCPDPLIAVWGLAYKEDTHSTKNSPSLATIDALSGLRFQVHDPVVRVSATSLSDIIEYESPLKASENADVLMILTPWHDYREVAPADIAKSMAGRVIIDPYRTLDSAACRAAGFEYHTLGVPPLA